MRNSLRPEACLPFLRSLGLVSHVPREDGEEKIQPQNPQDPEPASGKESETSGSVTPLSRSDSVVFILYQLLWSGDDCVVGRQSQACTLASLGPDLTK